MRLEKCSSWVLFKKWQVWVLWYKTQSGGKTPQIQPSPKQNRFESQCSCILQEPLIRARYVYVGLWVKYDFGKSSCISEICTGKSRRISVSVFLSSLQLTALLLKKFRLRLHCYTQIHTGERTAEDKLWTCSVQVFEEMVVNRFWTVIWMPKPCRAARGLRRRRIFFGG